MEGLLSMGLQCLVPTNCRIKKIMIKKKLEPKIQELLFVGFVQDVDFGLSLC